MSHYKPEQSLRTPAEAARAMHALGMSVVHLVERGRWPAMLGHPALGFVRPDWEDMASEFKDKRGVAIIAGHGHLVVDIDDGESVAMPVILKHMGRPISVTRARRGCKLFFRMQSPPTPPELAAACWAALESGRALQQARWAKRDATREHAEHEARKERVRELGARFIDEHGLIRSCKRSTADGGVRVEVLSYGSVAVIPPSIHEVTGRPYAYDGDPPSAEAIARSTPVTAVQVEAALTELFGASEPARRGAASASELYGVLTPDELGRMLDALDASDYATNELWFPLMAACHHATAGEGFDVFMDFCRSDQSYRAVEHEIRKRWRSLGDRPGAATVRTLYRELRRAGRADRIPNDARADFEGDPIACDELLPAPSVGDGAVARATTGSAATSVTNLMPAYEPKDHVALAEGFLRGRALIHWDGDWLEYRDGAYAVLPSAEIEAQAWCWLNQQVYTTGDGGQRVKPSVALVENFMAAARSLRHCALTPPCWLERRYGDPDPSRVISLRNGLLDLDTLRLLPPDPRFFTLHALPFDYDRAAPEPTRWKRFLNEAWPDDPDSISALHEIVGYLVSGDTSMQKMFLIFGPPRSGKGTIDSVLRGLLGERNCCGPTVDDLSGDFGLQGLIGKTLATVSDVRIGPRTNTAKLAGNLLRISGEDRVSVNRKYKTPWDAVLPTRILMFSNDVPHIRDTSGALQSRFVVLRMTESFLGREDTGLKAKLAEELPSILNWALDGLTDLRMWGAFTQPESGRVLLERMEAAASPVRTFVKEECLLGADQEILKENLYRAFEAWTGSEGITYHGGKVHFMRDLESAARGAKISEHRPRDGDDRRRLLKGIGLRRPLKPDEEPLLLNLR